MDSQDKFVVIACAVAAFAVAVLYIVEQLA
jgi:hypothetical protein